MFARPANALAGEVFRLNALLVAVGDALVEPLGLTSARWQVMGAVVVTGDSATVPIVARRLGLKRQSVQRVVNELIAEKLVSLFENPQHRRARIVQLTATGRMLFDSAQRSWEPIADAIEIAIGKNWPKVGRALARVRISLEHEQLSSKKAGRNAS